MTTDRSTWKAATGAMPGATAPWSPETCLTRSRSGSSRVAVVGISHAGLYLIERLRLRSSIHLTGVFDSDPARRAMVADQNVAFFDNPISVIASPDTDAVFFMHDVSRDLVSAALKNGKHVILHEPWRLSSADLFELAREAALPKLSATISCFDRWSDDFAAALEARKSGRLGTLETVRFSSCEMGIPLGPASTEILKEFGYRWLDQLLLLVNSPPHQVFAKRFTAAEDGTDHGLWATIEFDDGCLAQIDFQVRSRLAHRTGWMLEGSSGSYRNHQLLTVTADGEVIDEPLPRPLICVDSFFVELDALWLGQQSTLPTLADAARVVLLIEQIMAQG